MSTIGDVQCGVNIVSGHGLVTTASRQALHKEREQGMHVGAVSKVQRKKLAGLAGLPWQ